MMTLSYIIYYHIIAFDVSWWVSWCWDWSVVGSTIPAWAADSVMDRTCVAWHSWNSVGGNTCAVKTWQVLCGVNSVGNTVKFVIYHCSTSHRLMGVRETENDRVMINGVACFWELAHRSCSDGETNKSIACQSKPHDKSKL